MAAKTWVPLLYGISLGNLIVSFVYLAAVISFGGRSNTAARNNQF